MTPAGEVGEPTFSHPGRIAAAAGAVLAASAVVARQRPVPDLELRLTRWFNAAPDWVARGLWPVMQVGSLLAPLLVAAGIWWFARDRLLAVAALATGLLTWAGAKVVKDVVRRDRPVAFLPDVAVRDGSGAGLGYLSGHSAVAASLAVVVMAALPRRARPAAVAVALAVGIARIVVGVHLPADVVGGWAFGTLTGLAGVLAVDRLRGRAARAT